MNHCPLTPEAVLGPSSTALGDCGAHHLVAALPRLEPLRLRGVPEQRDVGFVLQLPAHVGAGHASGLNVAYELGHEGGVLGRVAAIAGEDRGGTGRVLAPQVTHQDGDRNPHLLCLGVVGLHGGPAGGVVARTTKPPQLASDPPIRKNWVLMSVRAWLGGWLPSSAMP